MISKENNNTVTENFTVLILLVIKMIQKCVEIQKYQDS